MSLPRSHARIPPPPPPRMSLPHVKPGGSYIPQEKSENSQTYESNKPTENHMQESPVPRPPTHMRSIPPPPPPLHTRNKPNEFPKKMPPNLGIQSTQGEFEVNSSRNTSSSYIPSEGNEDNKNISIMGSFAPNIPNYTHASYNPGVSQLPTPSGNLTIDSSTGSSNEIPHIRNNGGSEVKVNESSSSYLSHTPPKLHMNPSYKPESMTMPPILKNEDISKTVPNLNSVLPNKIPPPQYSSLIASTGMMVDTSQKPNIPSKTLPKQIPLVLSPRRRPDSRLPSISRNTDINPLSYTSQHLHYNPYKSPLKKPLDKLPITRNASNFGKDAPIQPKKYFLKSIQELNNLLNKKLESTNAPKSFTNQLNDTYVPQSPIHDDINPSISSYDPRMSQVDSMEYLNKHMIQPLLDKFHVLEARLENMDRQLIRKQNEPMANSYNTNSYINSSDLNQSDQNIITEPPSRQTNVSYIPHQYTFDNNTIISDNKIRKPNDELLQNREIQTSPYLSSEPQGKIISIDPIQLDKFQAEVDEMNQAVFSRAHSNLANELRAASNSQFQEFVEKSSPKSFSESINLESKTSFRDKIGTLENKILNNDKKDGERFRNGIESFLNKFNEKKKGYQSYKSQASTLKSQMTEDKSLDTVRSHLDLHHSRLNELKAIRKNYYTSLSDNQNPANTHRESYVLSDAFSTKLPKDPLKLVPDPQSIHQEARKHWNQMESFESNYDINNDINKSSYTKQNFYPENDIQDSVIMNEFQSPPIPEGPQVTQNSRMYSNLSSAHNEHHLFSSTQENVKAPDHSLSNLYTIPNNTSYWNNQNADNQEHRNEDFMQLHEQHNSAYQQSSVRPNISHSDNLNVSHNMVSQVQLSTVFDDLTPTFNKSFSPGIENTKDQMTWNAHKNLINSNNEKKSLSSIWNDTQEYQPTITNVSSNIPPYFTFSNQESISHISRNQPTEISHSPMITDIHKDRILPNAPPNNSSHNNQVLMNSPNIDTQVRSQTLSFSPSDQFLTNDQYVKFPESFQAPSFYSDNSAFYQPTFEYPAYSMDVTQQTASELPEKINYETSMVTSNSHTSNQVTDTPHPPSYSYFNTNFQGESKPENQKKTLASLFN